MLITVYLVALVQTAHHAHIYRQLFSAIIMSSTYRYIYIIEVDQTNAVYKVVATIQTGHLNFAGSYSH